ncbi:MAG: hypothetical protein MI866_16745, partial [Bacteroidales bacterium]|nr:hypothetical protein [Bacteroidales bacterium]
MNHPFYFTYNLVDVGQVEGSVQANGQQVQFKLTNNSNPLHDLLKGMINLVFEPSHIWGEDNISWVDWYEESGSLKWVLSTE